jgi:hypothetical protein
LTLVENDLCRFQTVAIPPSLTPNGVQDRLPIGAQWINLELPDQQLDDVSYHHVLCRNMDPAKMGLAIRELWPKSLLKNDGAGSGYMKVRRCHGADASWMPVVADDLGFLEVENLVLIERTADLERAANLVARNTLRREGMSDAKDHVALSAMGSEPKLAGHFLACGVERHAAGNSRDGRTGNCCRVGDATKCGADLLQKGGNSRLRRLADQRG